MTTHPDLLPPEAGRSTRQDVTDPVERARVAQRSWGRLPVRGRLAPVRALRRLLAAECDALCAAVASDLGKPPEETLAGEVLPLADACRFLERQAARLLSPRDVPRRQRPLWLWGQRDTVFRRPRGVIGIIGTWNYPLYLNGVQIAQALTAGNAVVWKPSEVAPAAARALHDLLLRAGFAPDLCVMLEASREAGRALLDAAVDHVVFTGSAATGRDVARRLGERLVSSTLELSGCDAQFVLADADLALAARAAWFGATFNRGQTCLAVRRAFVHRSLYADFCAALREQAAGAGRCRLVLAAQARLARRLAREAVEAGARLPVGSVDCDETEGECEPLVVADARPGMAVCREASFAPLLAVLPFDTVEEALDMDAQCPYALGASVFSRDVGRAARLAAELRAGSVSINDVVVPTGHPATPFGGCRDSGWGVTQGAEGLLEMTVPQVVSRRGGRFRPHYDLALGGAAARQAELARGLLEAAHAPTLGRRLRGWWRLLRGARHYLRRP
jgi:acyl-CoA reductase-like NAD-dependent aldehyde dehydrogenase